MADLAPLKYGKVVGRFLANIADGPDLGDLPEFPPLTGTVTFTADAPKVLVAAAQPAPATYVQLPNHYVCELDEFGYLTWRGQRGIRLVAPNADTNPSQWTWRVSFALQYEGEPVALEPFSFTVPEYVAGPDPANLDTGATGLVDLTLVSPVPASPGNAVVRGERGTGIQIDGQAATYATLPAAPKDGAQYIVKADGLLYVYRATAGGWTPNGQGIVIRGPASATDWSGVTGKPSTFPPIIGSTSTTAVAGDDSRLSDARTPTAHTHTSAQISDATTVGRSLLTATDATAARTTLGTVAATDPRLTDARQPTAAGQVYDIAFKSHTGARAAGAGNVMPEGLRIERAITVSSITYRGETAGTGNLVVELRKNGTTVANTSATIAAANHAADTVITTGGPWSFAAGDRLTVNITTADSPAGKGLQASLKGVTV
ncbi:hypothetical protein [Nocardia seriolae]|uniref:hypothetical protein n=1 Tax=Nocardia seriolae TaxID=37332 RepID=UPI000921FD94|nr:hypothetical protein [Nocardia seriolae]OJF83538.1 hypothetical protein NS14008_36070 [Nocardia seriolae]QOW37801.1 hypothetical protein IMZ23_30760 [Nocardia seriolae]QUN19938.1 hypothetical protein KEC46_11830 [Nocardia seriolae]WNJ59418.1 hypothetical protein RMO66_00705 [Nocardia seriolae]